MRRSDIETGAANHGGSVMQCSLACRLATPTPRQWLGSRVTRVLAWLIIIIAVGKGHDLLKPANHECVQGALTLCTWSFPSGPASHARPDYLLPR